MNNIIYRDSIKFIENVLNILNMLWLKKKKTRREEKNIFIGYLPLN